MFKLFKKNTRKKKRSTKEKLMILLSLLTIGFAVASLAAFRGIIYLSDATFWIAKQPAIFILTALALIGLHAWLLVKKTTKKRIALVTLSVLSLLSLVINTIIFKQEIASYEPKIETSFTGTAAKMDGSSFMAGSAKGDITPLDYMFPMPLLSVLKFDRVVDPVYARVLAISDGKQEALYITLDMTFVPEADETLKTLSEHTGIPVENIFISATHTHGATPVSLMDFHGTDAAKITEWYGQVKETLLKTVDEARQNMVPARYGYGTGTSNVNVNRDMDGEKSVLGSNFDRYSDKTVRVMRFESLDGDNIGLVVNYAVHSVVANGALVGGLRTHWTSDLAGYTSRKLENMLDSGAVLYSVGAAGDQNPGLRAQYGGPTGGSNPAVSNLGAASYNVLDYLSEIHARDILAANENLVADKTDGTIYSAEKVVQAEAAEEGETIDYRLRIFQIGDVMFQGVDAEIVSSIGQAVTATSPVENTMLVMITNGYQGYIADDWGYDHNAFEAGNAKTKKGAGQKALVEGFTDLFAEMEK
ncbi:neutral/alkaline non-lysosomal ceramidase N-terminal domain-containing protein [Streptococcus ferus]|uniref:Neutral/alkaline non-lysosomal ceramidase n=1 Tax=Streptococcus ferus TaxID=1345 RepID=A0A2X3XY87_9STRE|nr:neutral/alkaline non-lysosomal ceramidase N-terminal domain-containing protein [Streptococcus ferus]SQF40171.1 neutral/alkaline non-lysosomal ceramidase [Streptococcus ferus]